MCSSSPARTPKLQLATEQTSTVECWIPLKNKTKQNKKKQDAPHPRAKKSKQNGRGVKLHLESNTLPPRYPQRAQIKPFVHQDSETQKRLSQT